MDDNSQSSQLLRIKRYAQSLKKRHISLSQKPLIATFQCQRNPFFNLILLVRLKRLTGLVFYRLRRGFRLKKVEEAIFSIFAQTSAMLERLLVGCSGSDPFSVIIVDPRTGVASWSYKGSELQGAAVGFVEPLGVSGDHLVLSIKDRPLIHALAVHPRDRYHQKSVVAGVVAALCINRDGSLLFAAVGTQLYVWLLSSGELLTVIDAHYQAMTRIALSADESVLFTASTDGAINCFLVSDIISQDRDRTVEPLRNWRAHTLAVKGLSVSCGSNPRVASCGLDHLALIHSVSLNDVLLKVSADRPLTACALDAAESRLFLGSDTGNIAQINLYALDDRREILIQVADEKNERVPVFNGHCDEITSLCVNADGSLLASGDSAGKYCIWEISSRQCLKVSTMRGPISSLRFVADWPSITASEHISMHPVFDLQRNTSRGEKIMVKPSEGKNRNNDFWHGEVDRLIAIALQETTQSEPNAKTKKKKRKLMKTNGNDKSDVVVLDDDIMEVTGESRHDSVSSAATSKEDRELIQKQQEEIQKLKRINAELYSFMAKELTDKYRSKEALSLFSHHLNVISYLSKRSAVETTNWYTVAGHAVAQRRVDSTTSFVMFLYSWSAHSWLICIISS
ncbi:unnamed protein product [Cylicocyclus nassatus]|uniref:WD_REPEATS_REGION domain-containing protein n=1 Tax=Cylicocyclus nassatus TaxID=53992 RepID=A0AA36HDJ1_CYLNA|nr:unnamed protein product [Cylicocyclus nassatus]